MQPSNAKEEAPLLPKGTTVTKVFFQSGRQQKHNAGIAAMDFELSKWTKPKHVFATHHR